MMIRRKSYRRTTIRRYHYFIIVNECTAFYICVYKRVSGMPNATAFRVRCPRNAMAWKRIRIPHISYIVITHNTATAATHPHTFIHFDSVSVILTPVRQLPFAYSLCQHLNLMFNRMILSASVLPSIESILQNRATGSQQPEPNPFNRNRNNTIRFIEEIEKLKKRMQRKRLSLFGNHSGWCASPRSVFLVCYVAAICIMVIVFTFTLSLKFLYPHTRTHAQNHECTEHAPYAHISRSNEPKRSTRRYEENEF